MISHIYVFHHLTLFFQLESALTEAEHRLHAAEEGMQQMKAELLLREDSYNKHFKNGGAGRHVLFRVFAQQLFPHLHAWLRQGRKFLTLAQPPDLKLVSWGGCLIEKPRRFLLKGPQSQGVGDRGFHRILECFDVQTDCSILDPSPIKSVLKMAKRSVVS